MNDKQFQSPAMSAAALEWTRRRLLRATTGGVVGLGLGRQAIQRAAAQDLCDFNLLVFSKKLGAANFLEFDCGRCQCEGNESGWVKLAVELFLDPNTDCDETDPLIPAGSVLTGTAFHYLRQKSLAGTPVGSFAFDAGAQLLDPNGDPLAEVTQLEGTLGFDSRAGHPGTARCEYFPNGAGLLKLTGLEGTKLQGCTVTATFETVVAADPQDFCQPWQDWVLWVDGILNCNFCPGP